MMVNNYSDSITDLIVDSFIRYLEEVRKKFNKFVIFVDRAAQHRSKIVQDYLQEKRR